MNEEIQEKLSELEDTLREIYQNVLQPWERQSFIERITDGYCPKCGYPCRKGTWRQTLACQSGCDDG